MIHFAPQDSGSDVADEKRFQQRRQGGVGIAKRVDTIVIGAGQAGLATSYLLKKRGREHVVLEQAPQVASFWRKRWDSFTTITPNWSLALPGFHYGGDDPDGFLSREQLIEYFERYVRSFDPPLHLGVRVTALQQAPRGQGYLVSAADTMYQARNVVVATGAFQRPRIPTYASDVPADVHQMHTDRYRNPQQLPPGAVLIVGAGASGCQIAEELRRSGRDVYVCVGRCGWSKRRYYGKDVLWWWEQLGFLERTVDTLPTLKTRYECNLQLTGRDGGRDLTIRTLARDGVILLGHLRAVDGKKIYLEPDLKDSLAFGDEFARNLESAIKEYARKANMEVSLDNGPSGAAPAEALETGQILEVDIEDARISTIIWATGYVLDFGWIHIPLLDEYGYPLQTRGVTKHPGLYFVGLRWLHKRKSSLIYGVGEDAAHIVDAISARE